MSSLLSSNITFTYDDTYYSDSSGGGYYIPPVQPYVTLPVQPVPAAEPVDDSPLAWLRRSVEELTELAYAA